MLESINSLNGFDFELLADAGGVLGIIAGLFIGAVSGFLGGLVKREKDLGANHSELLKQISKYAFWLGGVGLVSIIGFQLADVIYTKGIRNIQHPFDVVIAEQPWSGDYWNQFGGTLRFYNAPFSLTKDIHNTFKEDYLVASKDSKFEVLFFTGTSESEHKQFLQKWEGFDRALRAIVLNTGMSKKEISDKVKVQIYTSGRVPTHTFFLARDSTDQEVCLAYFYPKEMVNTVCTVERPKVTGGIYLTEKNYSFLNFSLEKYTGFWDDKWDSSGQENIVINIEEYLNGVEIQTPAGALSFVGEY